MRKISVICFQILAKVSQSLYNYPVFVFNYEGWSNFKLYTCINCGELFVVDWQNPALNGKTVTELVGNQSCPQCAVLLRRSLRDYPQTVLLPNGKLGGFQPDRQIISDNERINHDFFEITLE